MDRAVWNFKKMVEIDPRHKCGTCYEEFGYDTDWIGCLGYHHRKCFYQTFSDSGTLAVQQVMKKEGRLFCKRCSNYIQIELADEMKLTVVEDLEFWHGSCKLGANF
jgi:hypothetical protein